MPSTPQTVLLCDDDELLVELLDYRLSAAGLEVIVARDGGEALTMVEKHQPDAIVLDAMMPVMDGYQVLRTLRENTRTAQIPVIMLTARKQERDVISALNLGANEYMVKPFIPDELLTRLSRLLRVDS